MQLAVRCAALIALLSTGSLILGADEPLRMYSNSELNYRLTYPASWHISIVVGKSGPTLYSYSPSSALGQGAISTQGGAEIDVTSLRMEVQAEKQLRDRAAADAERFAHGGATISEFKNPGNPDIASIIRVAYDYLRVEGEDLQRNVSFYFMLSGKPFVLGLRYWKDDARAASYERTLVSILRNIRTTKK
jgi:hypothetical protein